MRYSNLVGIGISLTVLLVFSVSSASESQSHVRSLYPRGLGPETFTFNYQSHGIGFGDWITLFTLCLAPIVAHLFAGVPEPGKLAWGLGVSICLLRSKLTSTVILSPHPPRWSDRICHYNPTSILWRYFIILDRRVRCQNWTASDMAACNAHFWLGHSWESSEEMITRSRRYCIRLPARPYIDPLSTSAAKTLIVTLQGAQALAEVLGTISVHSQYSVSLNLGNVFLPLAIFGLLRLPAALWMSEDAVYDNHNMMQLRVATFGQDIDMSKYGETPEHTMISTTSFLSESGDDAPPVSFHPINDIRGIAVRVLYLAIIIALTAFTIYSTVPPTMRSYMTVTAFTQVLFFDVFLLVTVFIFLFYILRGQSNTTIIPCLTSAWYKVYTALLFLGMLLLILFAALETRKTWCGVWTTYPKSVPGLPGAAFKYCPDSIPIQTSRLSWAQANHTDFLTEFSGLITGSWTAFNTT